MRFEAIRSDTPYYAGLLKAPSDWADLVTTGGQVFVTRYSTDTITLEPAGAFGITPPATLSVARYDQSVALLEASLRLRRAVCKLI